MGFSSFSVPKMPSSVSKVADGLSGVAKTADSVLGTNFSGLGLGGSNTAPASSLENIEQSIYMRGGDNKASIVDAYGIAPKDAMSYMKNTASYSINRYLLKPDPDGGGSLLDLFGGIDLDGGFLGGIGSALSTVGNVVKDGLELANDAVERLGVPLLQSYNAIRNVRDQVKNDALGFLMGNIGKVDPKLGNLITDGVNIYNVAKNADWKSVGGVLNAVSKLTGKELLGKYIDAQAEVAWASALVQEAMRLGNHDAIRALRNKVKSTKHFKYAIASQVGTTAKTGDIDTLDEVMLVLEGKVVSALNPTIIQDILKNYQFDKGYKYENFPEYRKKVLSVLYRIDPQWDHEYINGEKVMKLSPWVNASKDAKTLFQDMEDYRSSIAIARSYPKKDTLVCLRETYPNIYLTR